VAYVFRFADRAAYVSPASTITMRRREVLATIGATLLGGCSAAGSSNSEDGEFDVGMTAVAFDPAGVTVSVGETVVWRNTSTRAHSVTAYGDALPDGAAYFASGGFESESAARDGWANGLQGNIDSGEDYTHRFGVPGTYEYFCIPHERSGMVGRVVVKE
jgi:plastocyanin